MYLDDDGRRPSLTPQLALRVAIIGGIALVAFALVFFRLWYLQVLSGDKYARRGQRQPGARDQGAGPARRDRGPQRQGAGGQPHRPGRARDAQDAARQARASGATSTAAWAGCSDLSAAADRAAGGRASSRRCPTRRPRSSRTSRRRLVYYLFENQEDFPGVTVEQVFLREYPHRQIGAHLFGSVARGHQGAAGRQAALPRRGPGRPRRPVGHRVPVRPLPARPERRQPGAGGRAGQPARPAAQPRGPSRAASCGCRWTSTCSEAGQRALGGARGRVRGDERAQRRGAGAWAARPSFDPNVFSKVLPQVGPSSA